MNKKLMAALAAFLMLVFGTTPAMAGYYKPPSLGSINGGPLPASKGGTGQTTASGAINALLPTQTGNSGKFLTTNGSAATWGAVNSVIPDMTGNSGKVLSNNGSAASWIAAPTASCNGCAETRIRDISGITVDNNSDDDGAALDTELEADKTDRIIRVTPGVYDVLSSIYIDNASNIKIQCEPGAIFRKKSGADEYLFVFRWGSNITFDGCQFEGTTTSTTANNFGEQGILCASCNGFFVRNNRFLNIGDAAVRSTTAPSDDENNNSFNTYIDHNYFYNISQVTTTPAGSASGATSKSGTNNFHFDHNTVENLKGSIKACTRGPASGIWIEDNSIQNSTALSTSTGVEICSVSNLFVRNNFITQSQSWGINAYTNPEASLYKWDWYNYMITGNVIYNVARGIRVSNPAYSGDSLSSNTRGIQVIGNTLDTVTGSGTVGITLVNGTFHGSAVRANVLTNISSGLYMTIPGSGVANTDNVLD